MTPTKRQTVERLFNTAQELQVSFWEAIAELEQALGIEADSPRDLSDTTVDELLNPPAPDWGTWTPSRQGTPASLGGHARANALSPALRSEIAKAAAGARWKAAR